MQIILGVFFHFIGGFASGSFYIPYTKVKGWAWESYWIVGGLFSWLIIPPLAAWLTIPDFGQIITHTSGAILWITYFFGILWGIGGLTYGLGVRYLGVSLGSSIILGLSSVFGALLPSVYYDFFPKAGKDTFSNMIQSSWGQMVILGLFICIIGIIICGKAGMDKEKDLARLKEGEKKDIQQSTEFKIGLGLIVAVISGILSSCFAFGIDSGKDMAHEANQLWKTLHPAEGEFLYQNNVTYIIILWGGLTTNLFWCMVLNFRNKTFKDYRNTKTPLLSNYIFCALAGTTWFLQFFFYGMAESKLGNGASSWILHMAFIILVANVWGLVLKEWSAVSRKTLLTVLTGIVFIILSILIVGYGNSIK